MADALPSAPSRRAKSKASPARPARNTPRHPGRRACGGGAEAPSRGEGRALPGVPPGGSPERGALPCLQPRAIGRFRRRTGVPHGNRFALTFAVPFTPPEPQGEGQRPILGGRCPGTACVPRIRPPRPACPRRRCRSALPGGGSGAARRAAGRRPGARRPALLAAASGWSGLAESWRAARQSLRSRFLSPSHSARTAGRRAAPDPGMALPRPGLLAARRATPAGVPAEASQQRPPGGRVGRCPACRRAEVRSEAPCPDRAPEATR